MSSSWWEAMCWASPTARGGSSISGRARVPSPHGTAVIMALLLSAILTLVTQAQSITPSAIDADLIPKRIIYPEELVSRSFPGNASHVDHFRLLQRDGHSLLIGARNIVYNISIHNLQEYTNERIEWNSRTQDSEVCFNKGKSQDDCHNYIRVLARLGEGKFLICGTNSYKPLCRHYTQQENGTYNFIESSGVGKCPFNPRHNSTYVFTDGHLYSGTVADFQGITPLIFRDPLKTDPNDYQQLNAPDFVHSFTFESFVFFFFRETATEYMNCGKRVYSRVARVCKDDQGGSSSRFANSWTSFLKSRLNCSVPGSYPFYFDEIQSTSDVISGIYGGTENQIIYAVFTTPFNSLPGSAVCAFSMQDILESFEGDFKEQESLNSNWLPVHQSKVPEPRPGLCVNDSRTLQEANVNFVKTHPLMDEAVGAFFGRPVITKASLKYRFTKLAVDPQVRLHDGGTVDVLFIATDAGIIIKAINALSSNTTSKINPVIIEEIRVIDRPIVNLQMAKGANGQSRLIVITDVEVKSVELHRCGRAKTCSKCVDLQDPYCAWFEGTGRCAGLNAIFAGPIFQNVTSGVHSKCPYEGENEVFVIPPIKEPAEIAPSITPEPAKCMPCVCPEPNVCKQPEAEPTPSEDDAEVTTVINPNSGDDDIPNYEVNPYVQKSESESRTVVSISRLPDPQQEPAFYEDSPVLVRSTRRGRFLRGFAYSEAENTRPVVAAPLTSSITPSVYAIDTLVVSVGVSCVGALVIGFVAGFLFSRRCAIHEEDANERPYNEPEKLDNLVPASVNSNDYVDTNKHINNLMNSFNTKDTNSKMSNAMSNASTTSTLLKPAKSAYI
ncbi:unnamed protein product [Meganyctiphanes norvegica]|uniref:Sema domain-containing protein n=1 Tax=Meganyctiphanes norvegica TaxID=48144 RepID=A0AAV2Q2R0_MEGNR